MDVLDHLLVLEILSPHLTTQLFDLCHSLLEKFVFLVFLLQPKIDEKLVLGLEPVQLPAIPTNSAFDASQRFTIPIEAQIITRVPPT